MCLSVCYTCDVTWYPGFAGEAPRPAPIRTGVKAGQYKRTFTGSLHFYELDAATTPLRPSTECRKPSASSVSLSFPSFPVARSVILTDSVSPSSPPPPLPARIFHLPTPRRRLYFSAPSPLPFPASIHVAFTRNFRSVTSCCHS